MTRSTRHLRKLALLGAGVLGLVLGGCPVTEKPSGQVEKVRLVPFTSRADMLLYFQGQVLQSMQTRQMPMFGGLPFAPTSTGLEAGAADNSSQGDAFTTTNLQEEGVDESDVFKSDGTYFYIVRDQSLRIVRARPTERMEEVGRLDLDVVPTEMYLYGTRLILLATRYGTDGWYRPLEMMWPPYYESSKLYVLEINIRNPEAPEETARVEIDGNLVSSRLTGGRLIAVLTVAPSLPENPTPLEVSLMGVEDFMPTIKAGDRTDELVRWQDAYHPERPDGYFMTTVVTLDADNIENILHTAAVVANAGTVYASTNALYLTDTDFDAQHNYRETTVIHKFTFDEDGLARYTGSGAVPGRPINQFSLSEYEGFLRIATHVSSAVFWGFAEVGSAGAPVAGGDTGADSGDATAQDATPPSDFNAVYVLGEDEQGGDLTLKGGVENVSPNEQLYAARFLGPRGYLITFQRIDPLITLDLSDPTDPRVVGQLVVPGYSEYLHPLGDDRLIGVGRSTATSPWGGVIPAGVQLTLFDVSDLANPTMIDHVELGDVGSWSEVSYTHKAFAMLEDQGRFAIPVMLMKETGTPGDEPGMRGSELDFNGVVAFHVDPDAGFEELARVAAAQSTDHAMDLPFYGQWQRAAFIGDTLYSITPGGVSAAPLSDPTAVVEVPLGQ